MTEEPLFCPPRNMPDDMINKEMIEFSNYPQDQLSKHFLMLTALHLPRLSDDDKRKLILTFNEILGIRPTKGWNL